MGFSRLTKLMCFPLLAAGALCLSQSEGRAENVFTPVAPTTPAGKAGPAAKTDDQNSMLRAYTWESSFDRAGDASKDAARQLQQGARYDCSPLQEPQKAQCEAANARLQQQVKAAAKEAGEIRDMQYIFADVSRVSDMAAVGSIGAIGYSELMKKNPSQVDSLRGVANIQETAGYVSYTSGAADISMGAYALAMQKRQLENIKERMSGKGSGLNMANTAVMSKISKAAEETKKAAYSHMMYGAGKVAVGYASMQLAKQNKKQAESLQSLVDLSAGANPYQSGIAAAPVPTPQGGVPYYQNNNPQFIMPSTNGTRASTAPSAPVVSGNSGGSSVLPSSPELRKPASAGNLGSSFSGAAGSGGASLGGPGGPELEANADENTDKTKEALGQSFEMQLGGGSGSRYGGGGTDSGTGEGGVAGLLTGMLGNNNSSTSNATGLNPNSIYRDATEDLDGTEQGSMAGVSNRDDSLFSVVKSKYNKMMEVGRLAGPGAVEVKN